MILSAFKYSINSTVCYWKEHMYGYSIWHSISVTSYKRVLFPVDATQLSSYVKAGFSQQKALCYWKIMLLQNNSIIEIY